MASIISDKPELLQCARVVAWLEELASNSLAYNAEQNLGNPLTLTCHARRKTRKVYAVRCLDGSLYTQKQLRSAHVVEHS